MGGRDVAVNESQRQENGDRRQRAGDINDGRLICCGVEMATMDGKWFEYEFGIGPGR
jgi:hypothetical protein